MADETNFEGIQGAGADIAENDPQRGDYQNTGLLFSVAHEKSFLPRSYVTTCPTGHFCCGEPSHHTWVNSRRVASTRLSIACWDSGVV